MARPVFRLSCIGTKRSKIEGKASDGVDMDVDVCIREGGTEHRPGE